MGTKSMPAAAPAAGLFPQLYHQEMPGAEAVRRKALEGAALAAIPRLQGPVPASAAPLLATPLLELVVLPLLLLVLALVLLAPLLVLLAPLLLTPPLLTPPVLAPLLLTPLLAPLLLTSPLPEPPLEETVFVEPLSDVPPTAPPLAALDTPPSGPNPQPEPEEVAPHAKMPAAPARRAIEDRTALGSMDMT